MRSLRSNPVFVGMRRRCHCHHGITQGFFDDADLTVRERRGAQAMLHLIQLLGFLCQIIVQLADSTQNYPRMPDQEVGKVALILLNLKE